MKAGDILAEVISPELLTLQLDLVRASLDRQLEEDTLARIKDLAAVPQRRVWETESRVAALKSQVETLRRKLETVGLVSSDIDRVVQKKEVLSAVPVRSPVSGVVVTFDKALGQAVAAQEVLFSVHNQARPWIMGNVSERDVRRVRVGQAVRRDRSPPPRRYSRGGWPEAAGWSGRKADRLPRGWSLTPA